MEKELFEEVTGILYDVLFTPAIERKDKKLNKIAFDFNWYKFYKARFGDVIFWLLEIAHRQNAPDKLQIHYDFSKEDYKLLGEFFEHIKG